MVYRSFDSVPSTKDIRGQKQYLQLLLIYSHALWNVDLGHIHVDDEAYCSRCKTNV